MSARKAEMFPTQMLGLSTIVVDHLLQSRVSASIEYQREFSEAMLRGDEFPPVTVFFDGKHYRLADGFHRYGARKILAKTDRRFEMIKCELRDGGRKEALIFSAGANQKFSIPRTAADTRKAVYMLLEFPEWLNASSAEISAHCGVSAGTVVKYRAAYCEENGIDVLRLPGVSKKTKGAVFRKEGKLPLYERKRKEAGTGRPVTDYKTRFEGKQISLGQDEATARAKLEELERQTRNAKRRNLEDAAFTQAAATRGLVFRGFIGDMATRYPDISCLVGHGCLVAICKLEKEDSLVWAVGRLNLSQAYLESNHRRVIVTYLTDGLSHLAALVKKTGVEIFEPDDFFDSLKGE